jgi:hypothetical protein
MSDTADVEARIEELESRISELEQLIHDGQADGDVTGMREFVEEFDPDSHPERALAIAYYLDHHQGHENFTSKDIEDGYRTCRVQKPANMSDVLAALEEKEWAMDDGKDGQTRLRRLTKDGLAEVNEVIDDGA